MKKYAFLMIIMSFIGSVSTKSFAYPPDDQDKDPSYYRATLAVGKMAGGALLTSLCHLLWKHPEILSILFLPTGDANLRDRLRNHLRNNTQKWYLGTRFAGK